MVALQLAAALRLPGRFVEYEAANCGQAGGKKRQAEKQIVFHVVPACVSEGQFR